MTGGLSYCSVLHSLWSNLQDSDLRLCRQWLDCLNGTDAVPPSAYHNVFHRHGRRLFIVAFGVRQQAAVSGSGLLRFVVSIGCRNLLFPPNVGEGFGGTETPSLTLHIIHSPSRLVIVDHFIDLLTVHSNDTIYIAFRLLMMILIGGDHRYLKPSSLPLHPPPSRTYKWVHSSSYPYPPCAQTSS